MAHRIQAGEEIDDFVVGERLHEGGMGELFRASKRDSSASLIMKVPRFGSGDWSEGLISFETEATILPTLKGPHVPAFVAVGALEKAPYLVMERIEGTTLDERLGGKAMPLAEVPEVGAAFADALHSVHQQEVVHLDVKPGNVILRPDGTAVLVDFGFAHHARYPDLLAEERRFRAGSAPYVAPEPLLGVREDRRSDIFSLGVALYEMTTGTLPFGEPDSDVRNRFWLDPAPPSSVVADVPPWLQEVILRCLEPRAERRYQSAAHVAFDLRHPSQVTLTARASKQKRKGFVAHVKRFMRAHNEHAARLRSPEVPLSQTPIVLVAVNTARIDDERHPAIRFAMSQILAVSTEFRVICLTVIPAGSSAVDHLVRLRHWAEPLHLPAQRLSLHTVESESPADVIVSFANHNNVDLVVIGAPSEGGRAWSQSTASTVSAKITCSVHVVRVKKR